MAANLTQISIVTRKGVRYTIYFFILFFIGRFALNASITIYRTFFPPPPPAATVAFGKLPSLPFPDKGPRSSLNYKIETPSGGLPVFNGQAKVYFMPKAIASLSSVETASQKARALGFDSPSQEVTPTTLRFNHPRAQAALDINVINENFSISYTLASDPNPLVAQPPTPGEAETIARGILSKGGFVTEDLTGASKHEYLRVDSSGLSTVPSLSEANLIRINLFRKEIDKMVAKTPNPNNGNVWFFLSGEGSGSPRQVIASEYHYFPIDEEQSATYPIKTAQEAFDELKNGGGYLASIADGTKDIVVRRVYLAYYDPGVYTEFYQPIVVFEGDFGFTAYVPAIASEYYGK